MPNTRSALKELRKAERRRQRNRAVRTRVRTFVKYARQAIAQADLEAAQRAVREAYHELDRAARKGVIHRNTAARLKSRLMQQFNRTFGSVQSATSV
ncbi:MAG: 30S ribosomal protein S20 [Anaerolineae bacterium]|nr:30S ribosomal protein S20 [Thermoflexus sp.]MDW8065837.1 30S ribosomal protein S20 [Anaerolineae bacterium]